MNCLEHCLDQWDDNKYFNILYNGDHVIVLDKEPFDDYLHLDEFGLKHFTHSFNMSLEFKRLLKLYFYMKFTRAGRVDLQLELWKDGIPKHNKVDNECCPDFSCCHPELLSPKEIRDTFYYASDEQRESMLFTFLGETLAKTNPDKKVFIANGKDEITESQN